MAPVGKRIPITIQPGTDPEPDNTNQNTNMLVESNGIYFDEDGKLRGMEGNEAFIVSPQPYNNSVSFIQGTALYLGSFIHAASVKTYLVFITWFPGNATTTLRAYTSAISDNTLNGFNNIAPLYSSASTEANSLATDYRTLGTNALSCVSGSTTITVTDTAHPYIVGNLVTISGASTFGGLSSGNINRTQTPITSVSTNSWTYVAGGTASSTASGGGGSILLRTGLIKMTPSSVYSVNGDRIKFASAADTGGITAAQINLEHIVQSQGGGSFYVETAGIATSSVTGGGGASTTYREQDHVFISGSSKFFPSVAQFGDDRLIFCFGQPQEIWSWAFDGTTAMTALTNAPNARYIFVSTSNQVCALGGGAKNRFKTSDVGDPTEWTPGADTLAFEDDIENIGELISHAPARGNIDVLFTQHEVVLARYVGLPKIWDFEIVLSEDGIIGAMARVVVEGTVYWCGQNDFYSFDGGSITHLPNNTIKKYFLQRLQTEYQDHIFAFHAPRWKSVGWMFPINSTYGGGGTVGTGNGLIWESILYNYEQKFWYLDDTQTVFRQAAEQFSQKTNYPIFVDARQDGNSIGSITQVAGTVYRHGVEGTLRGFDFKTKFAKIAEGDYTMDVHEIFPDSIQVGGNIDVTYTTKEEANSTSTTSVAIANVTPTDTRRDVRANGRYRQIRMQSDVGLTSFAMGNWNETASRSAPR